jgi:hypothetical protein
MRAIGTACEEHGRYRGQAFCVLALSRQTHGMVDFGVALAREP